MRTPYRTRMFLSAIAVAAMLPFSAAAAAPRKEQLRLTLQQQTALRCSAAFAIATDAQARGGPGADGYPPLAERGREFFVRSAAQLMDERNLTREQIADLIQERAQALWDENAIESSMPGCLLLLDASGL